jgi:hypothetical protein
MDSSSQNLHATDLRRKLAELAAELLKTEDELVALESEGQLHPVPAQLLGERNPFLNPS